MQDAGKSFPYLACKDPTQANDDQYVEDSRANYGAESNVSFSDEDTWGWRTQREGQREGRKSDVCSYSLALFGFR